MDRIILKISGEALKEGSDNVSKNKLDVILKTIQKLQKLNKKVAIVIGGGNFFRGREHQDMDAVRRDTIGMLGTVMNALYVEDYLMNNNISCICATPFDFPKLIPNYTDEELKILYEDNVIIFGGGVGMSGYSTDSGVILATKKIDANLIIKMTNVDGVYDSDPKINKDAHKFSKLTYEDVLKNEYQVMDLYAVRECMNNHISILVMNFNDYDKIEDVMDNKIGTFIGE